MAHGVRTTFREITAVRSAGCGVNCKKQVGADQMNQIDFILWGFLPKVLPVVPPRNKCMEIQYRRLLISDEKRVQDVQFLLYIIILLRFPIRDYANSVTLYRDRSLSIG